MRSGRPNEVRKQIHSGVLRIKAQHGHRANCHIGQPGLLQAKKFVKMEEIWKTPKLFQAFLEKSGNTNLIYRD
jgi:hypothetical protein